MGDSGKGTEGQGQGGGEGGQGSGQQEQPTITEAQLKERLARQASQFEKKYADYDDLVAAKKKLDDLEAANLSEQEKLKKQIEALEAAQADAAATMQARELEVTERLVRAEVRTVAAELGFTAPEDAYSLADLSDVAIDDEGAVQGVKKALDKLAKEKPYLLKGDDKGRMGTPPRGGKKAPAGQQQDDRPIVRY